MFAFALVVWELLTGERPWGEQSLEEVHATVAQRRRPPLPAELADCLLADVARRCWAEAPEQRPTFAQLSRELDATAAPAAAPLTYTAPLVERHPM